MRYLVIRKIDNITRNTDHIVNLLDNKILGNVLSEINWGNYNYKPNVSFKIVHDNQSICLQYKVSEMQIKAVHLLDNAAVHKDSCAEFFIRFDNESFYYNIECNCLGFIKMAVGSNRHDRQLADTSTLDRITRNSSLKVNGIKESSGSWEISLLIPKEVFFHSKIDSFSGMSAYGNFYKCGDDLKVPHYLTYFPIDTPQPDFHRPEKFGKLIFE